MKSPKKSSVPIRNVSMALLEMREESWIESKRIENSTELEAIEREY